MAAVTRPDAQSGLRMLDAIDVKGDGTTPSDGTGRCAPWPSRR
jgi:hypothetical protein